MEMIIPCEGLSQKRIAELADELRPLFKDVCIDADAILVTDALSDDSFADAIDIIKQHGIDNYIMTA